MHCYMRHYLMLILQTFRGYSGPHRRFGWRLAETFEFGMTEFFIPFDVASFLCLLLEDP